MNDRRPLTADDNPHGVRKGQVWEYRRRGVVHQLHVRTDPMWLQVRGKLTPGVITDSERTGYRSLAGFARLRLVQDAS